MTPEALQAEMTRNREWFWQNIWWWVRLFLLLTLLFSFLAFLFWPDFHRSPWERAFRNCAEGTGLTAQRVDACKAVADAAAKEIP